MESITNNMELVIYCIPAGDFFTPLNDADMAIEKWWHGKSREDVILLREKKCVEWLAKKMKVGWFRLWLVPGVFAVTQCFVKNITKWFVNGDSQLCIYNVIF